MSEYTDGGWKRDVIYLGSEAIAEIDANGIYELHNDHLGTPKIITHGSGSNVGKIAGTQYFSPYGEYLTYNSNTAYQPVIGYTGHAQTDPSGLIYMRGRYYSPMWHRFLNSDQGVDPVQLNQRAYVGGRPFGVVDFSGLSSAYCITATTIRYIDMNSNGKFDGENELVESWSETSCFGGGGGGGGGGGTDGSGSGQPEPSPKEVDCATLKAMGVNQEAWNRMQGAMIMSNWGPQEVGFSSINGTLYSATSISVGPGGQQRLKMPAPGNGMWPGLSFHSHPPGQDALNTSVGSYTSGTHFSDEDGAFMSDTWPGGASLVGTQFGLFAMTNSGTPNREFQLGGANWWQANCF